MVIRLRPFPLTLHRQSLIWTSVLFLLLFENSPPFLFYFSFRDYKTEGVPSQILFPDPRQKFIWQRSKARIMDDAKSYVRANSMQKRDALDSLNEFSHLLNWGKSEKILDVGCGPGDVTATVLKDHIPQDALLVGGDVSIQMINYAISSFQNYRTAFKVLDIEHMKIDNWAEESFDKVFSFYCFHWIQNQKAAVKNIYHLLKPGGQLFVIFLSHVPIFELYKTLSATPKWSPYMQDVNNFICKYHNVDNPAREFEALLKESGFDNVHVTEQKKSFTFDSMEHIMASIEAVNPFLKRIPIELLPSFREDVHKCAEALAIDRRAHNVGLEVNYSLIIAYGRKNI